jgi:uncharacterized Zn finger protein
MSRWGYYDYFEPSRPRAVQGGIKAQSKRGTFGESWWAKRWIAVLESFHIGSRLERGRSYARRGQVLSIDINKSTVKAKVQGSRPTPYTVTILFKTLTAANWQKLTRALSSQALFAAKLLAGEMPQDIEQVFTAVGLSLFPAALQELETECSCPDWSNPCKHIAAVYYLLGEEFDRDPFLLFLLRGRSRDELVSHLGGISPSPQRDNATVKQDISRASSTIVSSAPTEPLPAEASRFWRGVDLPEDLFGEVQIPPVSAALPKRLGNFPFWRGAERLPEVLEALYRQASQRGLEAFLGELREEESDK